MLRLSGVLLCCLAACTSEAAEAPSSPPPADPIAANLDVAAAAELLAKEGELVVLDVRTPGEYEAGHIENSVLLDYKAEDFATRLAALERDAVYLVHCESGGRSSKAFNQMKELGFTSLYHLDGGMRAWRAADQPVATK